jgi:uncharacterized RDD family membrane protein YckC
MTEQTPPGQAPSGQIPPSSQLPPSGQPPSWQPPEPTIGPAPGVAFGDPGPRLVAYIIDIIIVSVVTTLIALAWVILSFASGGLSNNSMSTGAALGLVVMVVAVMVIGVGYFPWYWARDAATPGMKMMGLSVVRDADGGPISGGQAIMRLVGYVVSGMVFYLGFVWILIDKRRRGWHDLIAGTVVIRRP